MKKLISLILALALVMSMSAVVFAEDQSNVGVGDYTADVTGTYVEGTTGGTIFSVDIAWSNLSFTYHAEQQPVWDVNTHTYSQTKAAYWEGEGTITVTNHSNAKISATPTYNKGTGFESVNMTFSTAKLLVASAESGSAQTGTITVTPSGSLPANTEGATIGSITVTIAQDMNVSLEEAKELHTKATALLDAAQSSDMDEDEYAMLDQYAASLMAYIEVFEGEFWNNPNAASYEECQIELNSAYNALLNEYNAFKASSGL